MLAVEPEYKTFEGWNCDSTALKNGNNLPDEMQRYISFLLINILVAPVSYVSKRTPAWNK